MLEIKSIQTVMLNETSDSEGNLRFNDEVFAFILPDDADDNMIVGLKVIIEAFINIARDNNNGLNTFIAFLKDKDITKYSDVESIKEISEQFIDFKYV